MAVVDNMVVCKTEQESPVYVGFDTKNFKQVKEFGTIGHGSKEWVSPCLVANATGGYDIIDNGKKKIFHYQGDSLINESEYKMELPVNYPRMFNEKYNGYYCLSPKGTTFVTYNSATYENVDEFVVENETQGDNPINWELSWGGDGNCMVIAHLYKKEFYVMELDETGRFSRNIKYTGADYTFNPDKIAYYSDVCVSDKHIYLLNQEHVNLETLEGNSEIDVLDTSGKHIKKMELDIVAARICVAGDYIWLLDPENNLRVCKK